jgi:hypothetical protein
LQSTGTHHPFRHALANWHREAIAGAIVVAACLLAGSAPGT